MYPIRLEYAGKRATSLGARLLFVRDYYGARHFIYIRRRSAIASVAALFSAIFPSPDAIRSDPSSGKYF